MRVRLSVALDTAQGGNRRYSSTVAAVVRSSLETASPRRTS